MQKQVHEFGHTCAAGAQSLLSHPSMCPLFPFATPHGWVTPGSPQMSRCPSTLASVLCPTAPSCAATGEKVPRTRPPARASRLQPALPVVHLSVSSTNRIFRSEGFFYTSSKFWHSGRRTSQKSHTDTDQPNFLPRHSVTGYIG